MRWTSRNIFIGVLLLGLGGNLFAGSALAQEAELMKALRFDELVVDFYQEGRYAEAIHYAQEALKIREKALGPEHPMWLSLNNLAALYIPWATIPQQNHYTSVAWISGKKLWAGASLGPKPEQPGLAIYFNGQLCCSRTAFQAQPGYQWKKSWDRSIPMWLQA
jgi:hypothetical protein